MTKLTVIRLDTNTNPTASTLRDRPKTVKVKLVCLECGRKKSVSPNAVDPRCSCGSVDLEVL